ncbi:MAG: hypothetical protein COC09_04215 [Gammaproteobacteria bacterium]|nr:sulfotransferase family 2 domain-containing protein [Gammaproteobacteria bacterium]PCH64002.1 MAG: hypothetical protein COC09_04215 [Gammaproteobacteria bacterium]
MSEIEKKVLFFLHIPKTAGTTMNDLIRSNFGKANIVHLSKPYKHREELSDAWKRKHGARVVSGHFPFGIHSCIDINPTYFSVIRHPYQRVFSYYRYIQNTPTHYYHSTLKSLNYNFEEFLADPGSPEVRNQQVRLLSGCIAGQHETTDEIYQIALENIEHDYVLLGLQEKFDETLVLLKILLKLNDVRYYPKNVNNSSRGYQPNKREKELLDETNYYDILLYKHAEKFFLKLLEQHRSDVEFELQKLLSAKQSKLYAVYNGFHSIIDTPRRHMTKYLKNLVNKAH